MSTVVWAEALGNPSAAAVHLIGPEQSTQPLEQITQEVMAGFQSHCTLELLSPQGVNEQLKKTTQPLTLMESKQQAKLGRQAYRRLAFKEAITHLNNVQKIWTTFLPYLAGESMADLFLDLGLVHLEQGNLAGASQAFGKARFYGAPSALDPNLYPASAMEVYARGSTRAQVDGLGSLALRTVPPGAVVFLDGKEVGKAPLVLDSLVVGTHMVRSQESGHLPRWVRVQIQRDQTTVLSLRLPPEGLAPFIAWRADTPEASFRQEILLGESLGVRFVLSVGVLPSPTSQDQVYVRLIDVQEGILAHEKRVPLDQPGLSFTNLGKDAAQVAKRLAGVVRPGPKLYLD